MVYLGLLTVIMQAIRMTEEVLLAMVLCWAQQLFHGLLKSSLLLHYRQQILNLLWQKLVLAKLSG